MDERLVTIRLTHEEARLLSDSLSMSFIHDGEDEHTAKLEEIGHKILDAMQRHRKALRK